ncbi:polysaccharide deacetylase [Natrialba hulunbeirensis JCM 10989]|uniref:Polysaccharide deacetylase n=1 Tax=Natrialba hulunbeirensis JCM 10989 TaxID=1227493 RepID=L9ZZK9_9EURY|nr:polysaccharide deacetylase family protein [Natrialba hulunbeirensis]ELY90558.1 polysaccharide deacetylase [Natrialba hulunbeirensis JCM 10989]
MKRRTYLTTTSATAVGLALAGCMGGDESGDDPSDENGGDADSENGDDGGNGSGEPGLVGTFDDFESIDEWEAFQDIGAIDTDSERSYDGSQSMVLAPDPEDGQVRARRSLDDPIDIRDVVPGLAMTAEDDGVVLIQLQDEDGDYVEYSQQVMSDMPLARKNFGLTRVRGEPDLSEIMVLQIIRWFGSSGDEGDDDSRMWVDDFHFVPKPNAGKVMLQFHGGYETHHSEALPRVSEYGFPATTFVPTSRIRSDVAVEGDRLTEDQVADLANDGWTIGSHSHFGTHVSNIGPDEMEENITEPIDWLEDEGYDEGARFFAFPGSQYTESAYELVQEHYDLAFAGQTQAQGYAGNPHLCSTVSNPAPGEAANLLDWTATHGGITSLAFYQLEEEEAIEGLEETLEELDAHVEAGDLEVITPTEMADEYVH